MEISPMFNICTYCIFTLYGRSVAMFKGTFSDFTPSSCYDKISIFFEQNTQITLTIVRLISIINTLHVTCSLNFDHYYDFATKSIQYWKWFITSWIKTLCIPSYFISYSWHTVWRWRWWNESSTEKERF